MKSNAAAAVFQEGILGAVVGEVAIDLVYVSRRGLDDSRSDPTVRLLKVWVDGSLL